VNRDIATLSAVLSKAVDWGVLPEHPLRRMKPAKVVSQPIVRYLDDNEEKAIRNALDLREKRMRTARDRADKWRKDRRRRTLPSMALAPFADHLKPMVMLSMHTGLRQGSCLRWSGATLILGGRY
jgi:hypothetical protein